jgi:hypothetical protein
MIFPVTKSCYKIIKHVYNSNGVKISKLLKDTSVSQKIGYKHIERLQKIGILYEKNSGSLRIIKPNTKSNVGRLMFSLVEKEKELRLVEEKPKLKEPLENLKKGASNFSIQSAVLFGSFIKGDDKAKINMLVISDSNDKKLVNFLQACFQTVENAVIARILSKQGFNKFMKTKNNLYQELFRNHVCVYKPEKLLELIS